jgi:hypothetical protein
MSAQAILRGIVRDPETKLPFRVEAQSTLDLLEYLKIDDERETILYLLGTVVGLQQRIDALEKMVLRGLAR